MVRLATLTICYLEIEIIAIAWELLSNLVYGRPESSGFPARLSLVNPIDELHVGDHASQMTEAA